jgi:hypothetical protein
MREHRYTSPKEGGMAKFLLWLILAALCWPLALAALILYPFIWLLLLPFRVLGIAVEGVLGLVKALFLLPARVLSGKAS